LKEMIQKEKGGRKRRKKVLLTPNSLHFSLRVKFKKKGKEKENQNTHRSTRCPGEKGREKKAEYRWKKRGRGAGGSIRTASSGIRGRAENYFRFPHNKFFSASHREKEKKKENSKSAPLCRRKEISRWLPRRPLYGRKERSEPRLKFHSYSHQGKKKEKKVEKYRCLLKAK